MSTKSFLKFAAILSASLVFAFGSIASAETCTASSEMDAPTKSSIDSAARQMFAEMQQGDVFSLKQNSIPTLASNFGSIEQTIVNNKARYAAATMTVRNSYMLDAPGTAPIARADFLCGVWGQPDFTQFVLPNLPPGKYAVVISDLAGQTPSTLSLILQQQGAAWKLAGYYPQPPPIAGKDGNALLQQARTYKSQGQTHNAWFYYLMAWDRLAPVSFMYNKSLEAIRQEIAQSQPSDLPTAEKPFDFSADGKTYKITTLATFNDKDDVDLVLKYQTPDLSNTMQVDKDNKALVSAFLARYPEYKSAFSAIVARAVAPNGQDFGTLISLKDNSGTAKK
jgi:hypothetical protein